MRIFQISPIRTGTTLIWNILRKIFSQIEVYKANQLDEYVRKSLDEDSNIKVVSTIRDPRDTLCSYMTIWYELWDENNIINKKRLDESIDFLRSYSGGFDDFIELCNINDNLVLKYELFWDDYDYIFNEFEKFFNINIDNKMRIKLKNECNVKAHKKIADKFDTFFPIENNIDLKTQIHGKHISDTNGVPNQWKNIIPEEYQEFVTDKFKDILTIFNYSKKESGSSVG